MTITNRRRAALRWTAVALLATGALTACGGDDAASDDTTTTTVPDTTTTTAFDEAAEEAEVSALLTEFFKLAGEGEFAAAAAMIENGDEAEPRLVHCADLVAGVTIEMTSVEFPDQETATALFAILKNGEVLLAESGGGAVMVDGEWLVSENSFLSLYDIAKDSCTGTPPPE